LILAVSLGAFGAHSLKAILSLKQLQTWSTATDYHFYHALGLIGLGIWSDRLKTSRFVTMSGLFLMLGILLFSGSLYLLSLTGITIFGMVTPAGGIFFLFGWFFWIVAVLKDQKS
jgi:uncharacterized membrane protein YgdD (TMEM256/DUF423 family)